MHQPLIVLKFGGTALGSPRRIRRAALRVARWRDRGLGVLAVVSAAGRATDRILGRLAAVNPARDPDRESDQALATGEMLSAALLAHALLGIGVPARSLSGPAAGLYALGSWGRGRLDSLDDAVLLGLLSQGETPVVAGFQAATSSGDSITLGRGASDLSAVFLASQLEARECHIVTDVCGVFAADPRGNSGAARFERLTPDQLSELTAGGAQVVQHEAAVLAQRDGVPLRIYRWDASLAGTPGTVVAGEPSPIAAAS